MSETTERQRKPRFNHVAMSVPAELLSAAGRAELLRFYEDVFGWTEIPSLTEDEKRLVLQAYRNDQFVFLVAVPLDFQLRPETDLKALPQHTKPDTAWRA